MPWWQSAWQTTSRAASHPSAAPVRSARSATASTRCAWRSHRSAQPRTSGSRRPPPRGAKAPPGRPRRRPTRRARRGGGRPARRPGGPRRAPPAAPGRGRATGPAVRPSSRARRSPTHGTTLSRTPARAVVRPPSSARTGAGTPGTPRRRGGPPPRARTGGRCSSSRHTACRRRPRRGPGRHARRRPTPRAGRRRAGCRSPARTRSRSASSGSGDEGGTRQWMSTGGGVPSESSSRCETSRRRGRKNAGTRVSVTRIAAHQNVCAKALGGRLGAACTGSCPSAGSP